MTSDFGVSYLLQKLDVFLEEHADLLRRANQDVREIQSELESMKYFLQSADESVKEPWLKDIREEAYDIEDVLDAFDLHLQRHHGNRVTKVFGNLKNRHDAAAQIRDIKERLHGIWDRTNRYSGNNNIGVMLYNNFHHPQSEEMEDPRDSSLHIRRNEIVGIEDSIQELVGWLTDERSLTLQLTSVVGMSGIGKTVLVKQVYDNQRVKEHFQCCAWVMVPRPCTSTTNDLLKLIVDEFHNETSRQRMQAPERIESMNRFRLVQTLGDLLNHKRYVLVLDGVWHVDALSDIKNALPCHGDGSRIIVTTTRIDTVEAYDRVCQVAPLLAPHDYQLFIKKALPAANLEEVPPQLDVLSWKILDRCKGLPLAIVTMGNLLRNKGADVREWEKVLTSSFDGSRAMSTLTFSYRAMPSHLKPLLMYLGVFPEGQLIKRMRLIRLWIAEGLIEENAEGTMEEIANECLNELIGHSVIQVAERSNCGRVKSYRVHPLMLSFIVLKAKEQNFYVFSTKKNGASRSNAKIRRLSISGDDTNGSHDSDLSHVRSFFAFRTSQPRVEQLCTKFRCLLVLDLESAPLTNLPESLAELIFLRYLSLANTRIRSLPNTIEKLEHMQVLNLKGTGICELPDQILKLKKLRHLLAYSYARGEPSFDCIQAVRVPRGIGNLTALQKLSVIQANGENGIVSELGKLTQLRRLGIVGIRNADGQSICSSISQMTNLNSFSAKSTNASELLNLHYHFSPSPNLQRVYLRGRLKMLPSWIRTHQQLTRLTLGWSDLKEDPFQELHVLGSLKELTILEAYGGNSLYCGPSGKGGGFPNLILLCLDRLPGLQYIQLEKGAMPKLQKMIIGRCMNLSLSPLGIEYLTKLKQVELFAMSEDFMSRIRAERQGQRLRHIESIFYHDYRTHI